MTKSFRFVHLSTQITLRLFVRSLILLLLLFYYAIKQNVKHLILFANAQVVI